MFSRLLEELGSSEYQQLRPSQQEVLDSYTALLGEDGSQISRTDVAIEMPAGTGKSLVALLIAEKHRRLGHSIALLTGTKQLANQVSEDATDLGLDTIVFEGPGDLWSRRDLRMYRQAQRIAIMNYWAYFNIRPTPSPANILIMDDAHLAENTIRELFTVKVSRRDRSNLYSRILMAFVTLRPERYRVLDDIVNNRVPPSDPMLIPFSDWIEVQSNIVGLLDSAVDTAISEGIFDSVRFNWPIIRQHADALATYVTSREIELRPIVFSSLDNEHFAGPMQRVYLSATIGDPQDFQRRIGCRDLYLIRPDRFRPGERGRRFVVLFPSAEEDPESDQIRRDGLHGLWPVARKRLWMCRSWDEVDYYKDWTPPMRNGTPRIWELRGSDETQLDQFRQARIGHLFTAARYDGIDFPGDQARLAIIPSPPIAVDVQEEFYSAFLRDASFMKSRFSQRVAQALGRCNRDSADFAVYVLLHPRFERVFGGSDPEYLALLPRDIMPEVEAALDNTEDGFVASCEKAARFLSGDFEEWDHHVASIGERPEREGTIETAHTATNEVIGWLALWRGDPSSAIEHFNAWQHDMSGEIQSGYLGMARYCLAWTQYLCYRRQGEQGKLDEAIDAMRGAAQAGPSYWFTTTLRGALNDLIRLASRRVTPSEQRMPSYTEAVLQAWDDILYERGLRTHSLSRWLDRCLQELNSRHHDEVAEGLATLGRLLGFESQRPRGDGMPDTLWRYARDQLYIVTIEVKAELEEGRPIALRDVNQAHGQSRWAQTTYGSQGFTCIPLLVSQSAELDGGVSDRLGSVRCLTQATMVRLAETVRSLFEMYRSNWSITRAEARASARQSLANRIPQVTWLFDAYRSGTGFISEDDLTSRWGSPS